MRMYEKRSVTGAFQMRYSSIRNCRRYNYCMYS